MAEPPATSLEQTGTGRPDGLLATKLYLPRALPGFVSRPRLVGRLDEGLAQGLMLVCAPAGFGKTALLADWARQGRRLVAWLSLDQADNDPARLWRHVAAALDRVRPGLAEQVAPLLGPPAPASFEGLVTALINELAAQPDQVLLVLDDYHLIDAQPVHASLAFLVEHLPPSLRLILASRTDPPLGLARLRARGQLAELHAADLRFTPEEAAAVLRETVGPELPDAAVTALAARTEGWAAGLQLAALSLRGQPDVAGFVATFSGSHRYVLDFLSEEVLERQPAQVRGFLLETSVLERLSGELCDAITGRTDSQALLEAVERANLFLVPLDEVRGWWRYHHLFADLLRARLQQERPERVPALHRAAAAWSEAHGLADDAVRHALAAGNATWAARLVERHVDRLLVRSERATVQRWLAALPADLVGARPRLLLAQGLLALVSGRVEAVEGLLDAAERALAGAPSTVDAPFEPSVGTVASLVANIPAAIAFERAYLAELHGDAEHTIAFGHQALAELGEGEWMLDAIIRGHLAVAEWLRGRLPEAERALSSNIAQWRAAGERYLTGRLPEAERALSSSIAQWRAASARYQAVRDCHHLGLVQRAQGRLDAAFGTYQQALEIAAAPGQPALPAAGIADVGLAAVAYQRGELDTALEHVTEGIARCRQLAYTQPLVRGLATLACIRQATGDPAGALEAIGEAERFAPSPDVTSLLNPVPAQRARLLLAQGDVARAVRWIQQRGLRPDDEVSYQRERDYLVLARVLLASSQADRALGLLERLDVLADSQGRTSSLIEIRALRSLALQSAGDHQGALSLLAEALKVARPEGYIRVFADEGRPMAALLRSLSSARQRGHVAAGSGADAEHLYRVIRAFGSARGPADKAAPAATRLFEPLTDRELEVLRLLAAGKSNREIAQELVVTLETVKKHASHIFDKLGAANRTQAVANARRLSLIS